MDTELNFSNPLTWASRCTFYSPIFCIETAAITIAFLYQIQVGGTGNPPQELGVGVGVGEGGGEGGLQKN